MSDRKNSPADGDLVASRSLVKLSIDPATGRLLDASQAAVDFYGYSREALRSLFVWDLNPDSPPAETLDWLAAVAAGQRPDPRPGERHRLHGGAWREVMVYPDLARHAGQVSILATVIDVTEARRTEARLRTSEEQLRALVLASSDVVYRMSPDWTEMRSLLGREFLTDTDTPSQTWLEHYIFPEDRPQVLDAIGQAIRFKRVFELEHRVRRADGSAGYTLSRAIPLFDAHGEITEWFGMASDVTARKQDELALREAQERFQAFMNNSPAIAWMKDEAGRILYLNRTFEQRFGIRLDDVQGKTTADIWPPEIAEQFRRQDRMVIETGQAVTTTEETIDSLDQRSWWLSSKFLVTDAAGCRFVGGIGIDISELKQAELLLRHYRQIVEVSTEKLALLDRDLRYRVVNPAYAALYQSTPEALQGRTMVEVVPPSIWEQGRPHLEAALAGEPQHFQIDVSFPDGHTRSIEVEEQPFWEGGEVQGIIASLHDLTERRDAQAALVASEAKARAVIDSSPIPLAIAHQTGPVHYLNAAFVRTYGYTLEDLTIWDDWWRQAVPDPAERTRVLRVRQERPAPVGREGMGGEPLEVRVRCKDGMHRSVMISTTPLGGAERLYTLYDITDLKRAMAAAEQAARTKAEFLAHMSHEIRTPLNSVLGLMQVLERSALAPDQWAMVRQVMAAGRSLLGVLNDILDLSQIEARQLALEANPFGLDSILAAIDSLLGPTARGQGIELEIAAPPDLPGGLLGDPLRLQQVLVNLIGNAIKFTERGAVRLRIEPLDVTATTVRLRFAVHDTGIGFSDETLAELFSPFTQGDRGITRRYGGAGLGLAICKRLVGAMGGTIGAESRPGKGSTFWFEVSFGRMAEVPLPAPARAGVVPGGRRLAGLHLLVVDDSVMNREVVERMLVLEGARATLVGDGRQAVERLRIAPSGFDAVLMDVQMPVMDGLSATRLIRNELGLTGLPIFATTAGVLAEEQAAARTAGVDDVLTKPLDLEQLVTGLRPWVRTRPRAKPNEPPLPPAGTGWMRGGTVRSDDLPDLPGIDREWVARNLDHGLAFFQRLLERFVEDFAGVVAETRRALAAGEREAAIRQMYTLEGTAGALGALQIMATAVGLVTAIKEGETGQGETGLDTRLDTLDTQVAPLIAAATAWCESIRPRPVATDASPPLEKTRLDALREALAHQNLRARRDLEVLQPALLGVLGEERMEGLTSAIRGLRFTEALALLDQALVGVHVTVDDETS